MKHLHKLLLAALGAAFFMASAQAQNAGSVTNHAFAIGKGAGTTGYTSLLCGSAQLAVGQAAADPICRTVTGDVTIDASGVTAIGASKVTNSQLATMAANTTKCNATAGTANPTDCNAATMRTNLGLVVGTNVQAWDADLDCIAALSSTGVISRTGSGTCSAEALALSGLATGTQDTVIGYFGSTTASATAVPNCSGALTYSTATHTFGCGSGGTATPVLASRASASTQDLSDFSAVQTLGYSTAGDGGGAVFQKIVGNFIDTRITAGSITNNGTSGCTNGTYYTLTFSGGNGRGELGGTTGVVTVSGNVVTSIANVGGYNGAMAVGYTSGDVLSVTVPGCASTVTWTISSVSTPTGSFTDSAGNKWQITFPAAGLDARSFGVKFDWDGTDGTATDNYTTLQNAFSFAWYKTSTTIDGGGTQGGQVLLAKQSAMIGCSATVPIMVPYGVKVKGQGNYSSVIKMCDTFPTSVNQWELCNSFSHLACFASLLEDFQIFNSINVNGSSGRSVVYTNNAQHEAGMRRMTIYNGSCGRGATYETGYGGATYILLDGVEFKGGKSDANCGGAGGAQVFINYGTTQVLITNLNVSAYASGSGGPRQFGLVINGGFVDIVGFHAEQVVQPAQINIAGGVANGMVRARSVIGGASCVGLFTLPSTNTIGNFMISPPMAQNGCTNLVTNSQTGASGNMTSASATDVVFTPNGHAW